MFDFAKQLKTYERKLRLKYQPRVARFVARAATYQARRSLKKSAPIKMLVDGTVLYHAVTHETVRISTGSKKWGTHNIDTFYTARVPVYPKDNQSLAYCNISYLAGIAELCRTGHVRLYTSSELQSEQWRQPAGRYDGYGIFDHSLLARVHPETVDGYRFLNFSSFGSRDLEGEQKKRLAMLRAAEQEYCELVKVLGQKNSQDAWHIYTAEKQRFFAFLTMDFKLVRAMEAQAENRTINSLTTRVLTPADFAKGVGIRPVSPTWFSYDDASFPVRQDLHMPDEQRRKFQEYG